MCTQGWWLANHRDRDRHGACLEGQAVLVGERLAHARGQSDPEERDERGDAVAHPQPAGEQLGDGDAQAEAAVDDGEERARGGGELRRVVAQPVGEDGACNTYEP